MVELSRLERIETEIARRKAIPLPKLPKAPPVSFPKVVELGETLEEQKAKVRRFWERKLQEQKKEAESWRVQRAEIIVEEARREKQYQWVSKRIIDPIIQILAAPPRGGRELLAKLPETPEMQATAIKGIKYKDIAKYTPLLQPGYQVAKLLWGKGVGELTTGTVLAKAEATFRAMFPKGTISRPPISRPTPTPLKSLHQAHPWLKTHPYLSTIAATLAEIAVDPYLADIFKLGPVAVTRFVSLAKSRAIPLATKNIPKLKSLYREFERTIAKPMVVGEPTPEILEAGFAKIPRKPFKPKVKPVAPPKPPEVPKVAFVPTKPEPKWITTEKGFRIAPRIEKPAERVIPKVTLERKIFPAKPLEVAEQPVFTEYQTRVLEEIKKLPELPKITAEAVEAKPNIVTYQNPYTKFAYKNIWNPLEDAFQKYAPRWAKTFASGQARTVGMEKQRVISGMTSRYTDDIIKPIAKLPLEEKRRMGEMINKTLDIPPEEAGKVLNIDANIGQIGKEMTTMREKWIAQGVPSKHINYLTEEVWGEHLGEYARTFYLRPKTVEGVPASQVFATKGKNIVRTSMFKRKLTLEEWGINSLEYQGMTPKNIAKVSTGELRQMGLEAKKAYGWRTEADLMLDKTFREMTDNYATMQWMDAILSDANSFSRTHKKGWTAVSDLLPGKKPNILVGPLNEGYINPALEDEIRFLVKEGPRWRSAILGEPLAWWKAAKVAGNPPTVIRNFVSGCVLQSDMAGFAPFYPQNAKVYVKSLKDYLAKSDRYKFWRDKGLYGKDYFDVEIAGREMNAIESAVNPMDEFGAVLQRKSAKARKKIFGYYGGIDHAHRTYLAEAVLKSGMTAEQAIHFANKWQLDYRLVPKWIEILRSPPMGYITPYISFPALMTPRVLEVLVTRPWVLAKYPAAIAATGYLAAKSLGKTQEEIEALKPRFLKDDPYAIPMPWKDKAGNVQFLSLGYVFPFGTWKTGFVDWEQIANMSTGGLAGSARGLFENRDPFTKKEIWRESDVPSVKLEKQLAWLLRTGGPGIVGHTINIYKAVKGEKIGWPYRRPRSVTQHILRAGAVSIYSGGYNELLAKLRFIEQEIRDINFGNKINQDDPNLSGEEKERLNKETMEYLQNRIKEYEKLQKILEGTPPPLTMEEIEEKMPPAVSRPPETRLQRIEREIRLRKIEAELERRKAIGE